MTSQKIINNISSKRVYLKESSDGKIDLAKFNFPDGNYHVSILDYEGDLISEHNHIIKNGRKIKLLRRFEGSKNMIVAQRYTIPLDNINNKVLQFIIEKCEDLRKIFIDITSSMNELELKLEDSDIKNNIDGTDINGQPVKFIDILKFYEKYIIVKGFMQVGKTKFIISSAVWHILNGMSSIIVLRNYNGDKDQMIRRVDEFNTELQQFLGEEFKDKFKIEAVCKDNIKVKYLNGEKPKIIVSIANKSPLKRINKLIEDNPETSKKFILYMDEVDFIDSDGTDVQNELIKLRLHAFCSFGVSATILDSTFKHDVDKGNVIILSTPENYNSVVNFKFIHLEFENNLVAVTDGNILNDMNLTPYLDDFLDKKPYYVELYDDEYGNESDIRSKCHHPVDSLMRVSICNNPNLRLLQYITVSYGFPVMYFQGGSGAGKVTAYIPDQNTPITLMNGSTSIIQKGLILDNNIKLDGGVYHIFNDASPALVKEWMKNKGGGVKRFPRIMTLAGGMAARCQSFGAADFNNCLYNKKLAWHLTEMYMSASSLMDQPELMQTAGRLCVVARDNIQPLFYSSKNICMDLIHAFQTQEELIERARKVHDMKCLGDIMRTVPMFRDKIIKTRPLTKKVEVKLNLVNEEVDKNDGGWSKTDTYCTRDSNGMILSTNNITISQDYFDIIKNKNEDNKKDIKTVIIDHKDQYKYISKSLSSSRNTKISVFLSHIDPKRIYTRNELTEIARKANYEQPTSIFLTMTSPKSTWRCGCIFESFNGGWKVKSELHQAWI